MNRKGAEVAKGRREYMEDTPVTWVASTLVPELRDRFQLAQTSIFLIAVSRDFPIPRSKNGTLTTFRAGGKIRLESFNHR